MSCRTLRRPLKLPLVLCEVGRVWLNRATHGYDYFGARVQARARVPFWREYNEATLIVRAGSDALRVRVESVELEVAP